MDRYAIKNLTSYFNLDEQKDPEGQWCKWEDVKKFTDDLAKIQKSSMEQLQAENERLKTIISHAIDLGFNPLKDGNGQEQ